MTPTSRTAASGTTAVALIALIALEGCQFFTGITPCLDDKNACPTGLTCDETVGICTKAPDKKPNPPPPPPPPTPGTCDAPFALTLGTVTSGDTTGLTTSNLKSGNCQGGDAGELVYTFTLDHDAHLHAEVRPLVGQQQDVQLYARHDDCTSPFDDFACSDDYPAGVPEQIANFDVKKDEPVFVIVDGFNIADVGKFTLDVIEVYDAGAACDATDTTKRCPLGSRCVNSVCTGDVPGDVCTSAIRIDGPSGSVSEDTTTLANDFVAGPSCIGNNTFITPANDIFYVVNVPANATLDAKLTVAPDIDQGLYMVTDCPPPADPVCPGVADSHSFGGNEELVFQNTGATQDFFLIVDGFTETQNGPFTIDYTITP